MKKFALAALCALLAGVGAVQAQEPPKVALRTGLGQAAPGEPAKLSALRLNDPLVQQKYLNDADMLRFLRGTYSEACTRGLISQGATQVKMDPQREFPEEARAMAMRLLESKRIWKMTSFEMEGLFGDAYLNSANYCDCVMEEVADADLVNPKKGIEVVEAISPNAQKTCERLAVERTARQKALREKESKKSVK